MSKRASGRARHLVRVELLAVVAELGPQCYPSQRAAARHLAERIDLGVSTIRRALADETIAAEVDLAVAGRLDPVSHEGATEGATREPPQHADANPQVSGPPSEAADPLALHSSTRALLSGTSEVPPVVAPGRRPKEFRRSRFAGRCVLCLTELAAGRAFYLVPYDTGTAVYCHDDAALGLAMAQMFYDVTRGRPIPDELELYARRRPLP